MTHLPARASPPTAAPLRGLFVAATDTGAGKTLVSMGILRLAARRGLPVVPYKPVESGVRRAAASDAWKLRDAAHRSDLPLRAICPFSLRPAIAPAAAGLRVTRRELVTGAHRLAQGGSSLLVESAGGLLSPYTSTLTCADLAVALGLPVLLVARNALGTINHTALSIEALRARRLHVLGILLVDTERGDLKSALKNFDLIRRLTAHKPLGVLPYLPAPGPDRSAEALATLGLDRTLLRPFTNPGR